MSSEDGAVTPLDIIEKLPVLGGAAIPNTAALAPQMAVVSQPSLLRHSAAYMYLYIPDPNLHPNSAQVFQSRFWMGLLGSKTAKPTLMMSNMETVDGLNKGKLTKQVREKKLKTKTSRV